MKLGSCNVFGLLTLMQIDYLKLEIILIESYLNVNASVL